MSVSAFDELPTTFIGHNPFKMAVMEKSRSSSEDVTDTMCATFYVLETIIIVCVF